MSSSLIVRLDRALLGSMARRLRAWFDELLGSNRDTICCLLGYSIKFLLFEIPDSFVEG